MQAEKKSVNLLLELLKKAYRAGVADIKVETALHKGSIVSDTFCGISAQVTNKETGYQIITPLIELKPCIIPGHM